ncbi:hypothetical protein DFS34DRAFT_597425 [Phlyctochytrium arcticum]|nr:hypothetical protein DFS34DRAFT_597425 [Phlyctochytrium arcticum]
MHPGIIPVMLVIGVLLGGPLVAVLALGAGESGGGVAAVVGFAAVADIRCADIGFGALSSPALGWLIELSGGGGRSLSLSVNGCASDSEIFPIGVASPVLQVLGGGGLDLG